MKLIITCEHAFPFIPEEFNILFEDDPTILKTHEAYDPGAFEVFKEIEPIADFSSYQQISRLIIETNRSLHHRSLFSRFSEKLPKEIKQKLITNYYQPYREQVEKRIGSFLLQQKKVLHLSIHSFTPVLSGEERNCDIGLLYDPRRSSEKTWARDFKNEFCRNYQDMKVRLNYPYLGKADGFTTYLRKKFPEDYLGIEIEFNQKLFLSQESSTAIIQRVRETLKRLV